MSKQALAAEKARRRRRAGGKTQLGDAPPEQHVRERPASKAAKKKRGDGEASKSATPPAKAQPATLQRARTQRVKAQPAQAQPAKAPPAARSTQPPPKPRRAGGREEGMELPSMIGGRMRRLARGAVRVVSTPVAVARAVVDLFRRNRD